MKSTRNAKTQSNPKTRFYWKISLLL